MSKTPILDHAAIVRKLDRMAVEIIEQFHHCDHIVMAAVAEKGSRIANELGSRIERFGGPAVLRTDLRLEKNTRTPQVTMQPELNIESQHVVLVDDVLNTGITLFAAAAWLLSKSPESLHTAVLLDRRHRKVPIRADVVGLTLSTTLQNHIEVHTQQPELSAWLV
jgi:pyrimidine operon attenuation protein/uracil phosphoribosyltransferase